MNRGLAIVEVNDTGTQSVFIDQDVVECARLNAKIKQREEAARKSEKRSAKRKAYADRTAAHVLLNCSAIVCAVWGCVAGLIHPVIALPVAVVSLCGACLRIGAWFGGGAK